MFIVRWYKRVHMSLLLFWKPGNVAVEAFQVHPFNGLQREVVGLNVVFAKSS